MAPIGTKITVDQRLSRVISHFYTIRVPAGGCTKVLHLSPSLEMMIIFNFSAPVRYSFGDEPLGTGIADGINIIGPLRQLLNYEIKEGTDLVILTFIYDGLYRFLSLPIDAIQTAELTESDTQAITEQLAELWELLANCPTDEKRIELLTDYLIQRLPQHTQASLPIPEAEAAFSNPLLNPAKVIAAQNNLSERAIQKKFKKFTGYSPKELVRFLRFKKVIAYLVERPNTKIDWFEIIVTYGYHDQSHLNKDFKYFTGVAPQQFLKMANEGNFCIGRD